MPRVTYTTKEPEKMKEDQLDGQDHRNGAEEDSRIGLRKIEIEAQEETEIIGERQQKKLGYYYNKSPVFQKAREHSLSKQVAQILTQFTDRVST